MKKHIVTSALIHTALFGVVVFFVTTPPKEPKQEKTVKIEVVALQEPQPPKEEPKPIEKPKPKPKEKPKPIPVPDVVDVKPQPLQESVNVVEESKALIEKQSVVEPEVEEKVIEPQVSEPIKPQFSAAEIQSAKDAYLAQLRKAIEAKKVYPKNAKRLSQSGVVTLKFTVLRSGVIKNAEVSQTSSFNILDNAAMKILQDIAKTEPFPKELIEDEMVVVLPIEYDLKQQ